MDEPCGSLLDDRHPISTDVGLDKNLLTTAKCKLVVGQAEELPFADASFDGRS